MLPQNDYMPIPLWSTRRGGRSVTPMPKARDEDRQFAERLGPVLIRLRERAGWTREEASFELAIPVSTLGKWERGENAPKAYDLGRLFLGYERWGADPLWFLNPPAVITFDPIKDRLDALEASGAISADEREARVQERRRRNDAKRAAGRGTRPRDIPPQSSR